MSSALLLCLIVGVSDGDTLTARCITSDAAHPHQQVKVRLAEIDAPELGQPFGRRAKQQLSDLCYLRIPLMADSDSIPIADSVPGDGGHVARVS